MVAESKISALGCTLPQAEELSINVRERKQKRKTVCFLGAVNYTQTRAISN
jgi:hypothetical protein